MIRMKNMLFFLALIMALPLAAGISCSSSTQRRVEQKASDHAQLSVTYEVVCQIVEENPRKVKDLMRLDIGHHSSQFRSVIIEWIKDNGLVPGSPESFDHPFKGYQWLHYQVVKNLPKPGYQYFTYDRISTRDKTEGLFEWRLLEGDSTVCNYQCKKAETTFRGRTWTVWYAPLLAYGDGPWKFTGLPGLVLEARDAEGKLAFHAKKIEKQTGIGIVLVKKNISPMLNFDHSDLLDVFQPERAAELMMLEHWDVIAYHTERMGGVLATSAVKSGNISEVSKDGKKVTTMYQTAILYEKYQEVDVKKKYPPKFAK